MRCARHFFRYRGGQIQYLDNAYERMLKSDVKCRFIIEWPSERPKSAAGLMKRCINSQSAPSDRLPAGAPLLSAVNERALLHSTFRSLIMDIKRSGSQPSGKGPAEYFTGTVRIDPLIQAPDPSRTVSTSVTFEPGARTAWHTHPLGQPLIVTFGSGWK